jgi:hypothetical protein
VGVLNEMSLAMEKTIAPQRANLQPPPGEDRDAGLNITVVFTSVRGTSAALRSAAALVMTLGARINLVVLQVVPYPLPLTSPPVLVDSAAKGNFGPSPTRVRWTRRSFCICAATAWLRSPPS